MQEIGGIKFDREDYYKVKDEIKPLLLENWEETSLNKQKLVLNPDWDLYEKIYRQGNLGIYTARKNGFLIGYFVVVVVPHMHYKDHLVATNDILFISKEHRKGRTGTRLIQYAENDLKTFGVSIFNIVSSSKRPIGKLLERLKFSNLEQTYSKYIGE